MAGVVGTIQIAYISIYLSLYIHVYVILFLDATEFLRLVQEHMTSQLLTLPDRYSLTAMLDTWVRIMCGSKDQLLSVYSIQRDFLNMDLKTAHLRIDKFNQFCSEKYTF